MASAVVRAGTAVVVVSEGLAQGLTIPRLEEQMPSRSTGAGALMDEGLGFSPGLPRSPSRSLLEVVSVNIKLGQKCFMMKC